MRLWCICHPHPTVHFEVLPQNKTIDLINQATPFQSLPWFHRKIALERIGTETPVNHRNERPGWKWKTRKPDGGLRLQFGFFGGVPVGMRIWNGQPEMPPKFFLPYRSRMLPCSTFACSGLPYRWYLYAFGAFAIRTFTVLNASLPFETCSAFFPSQFRPRHRWLCRQIECGTS